jgi:2-(3-amino-3-carboxypropyl)histidine synthase
LVPYDLDLERVVELVKARGAKRVLIQAPDGLKQYVKDLCESLNEQGAMAIVSGDPCFGGCDLAYSEASFIGADLLVHIGHQEFQPGGGKIPTIYIPAGHKADLKKLSAVTVDLLKKKGVRRVGLVTTVQHRDYLKALGKALADSGIEQRIDEESGGIILGCRLSAAKSIEGDVDAFVFLGGGDFHGLGVALTVEKDVYIADPYRDEVRDLAKLKRKVLAKRWWGIMEATKAKSFGIIMVTKTGQFTEETTLQLKHDLEERGKRAYLIAMDEVNQERMAPFTFVDAFIITGCPRISIDNQDSFGKPVLNEEDALELLKRV